MNKEELENYLESIGGLYDWKGRTHTKANIFGVGEGWYSLLKNLIEELLEIGWDSIYFDFIRYAGLWANCRFSCRDVSYKNQVHFYVVAVPYWKWCIWRINAFCCNAFNYYLYR